MPAELVGQRAHRRRHHHGPASREPADPRRPVPSREHRDRARPPHAARTSSRWREVGGHGVTAELQRFKELIAKAATGQAAERGRGRRGVRADDDRQRHAGPDRRPADGAARARRDGRGDHRRARAACASAWRGSQAPDGCDRHLRHRRRRCRHLQHLDRGGDRRGRRRRAGRQARQSRPVLEIGLGRGADRSSASTSTPSSRWSSRRSARPGSAS